MAAASGMADGGALRQLVDQVRAEFDSGVTMSIQFRIKQLRGLLQMYEDHKAEILEALYKDMRKGDYEGNSGDILTVQTEINHMLKYLKKHASDEHLPFNLFGSMDKAWVRKEPFGVVLVIGTWNYPFQSLLQPFAGAIAAGNCAVLKPSEVTPECERTIAKLIPQYVDSNCYKVVTGDAGVAQALLSNRFDYIFFTGSPSVGRLVHKAATEHLTPVTLELGGKNPCYIDPSADFAIAAKRILWAKLINNGQICIAPDYLLCTPSAVVKLIEVAKQVLVEWYGEDQKKSKDIIRVVNKRHFARLTKLLESTKGDVAIGGQWDEADLWIEPTVVVNVDPFADALMQEEIFGPILPIVVVKNNEDAIRIMRSKPKPLAMYVFSKDDQVTKDILQRTSSGSVCINDVFWQGVWLGLPFGGVGNSGMGRFHGKYTFDTFSHKRAILQRETHFLAEKFGEPRYPPYATWKGKFFQTIIQFYDYVNFDLWQIFLYLLVLVIGVALGVLVPMLTSG